MMSFDTEPDHDEHSECRREIQELRGQVFEAVADDCALRHKLRDTEAELTQLRRWIEERTGSWCVRQWFAGGDYKWVGEPCSRCQLVATWGGKVSEHPGLKKDNEDE